MKRKTNKWPLRIVDCLLILFGLAVISPALILLYHLVWSKT